MENEEKNNVLYMYLILQSAMLICAILSAPFSPKDYYNYLMDEDDVLLL